ncbi:hypothetical protein [Scytonema sp. NUACC21]
MRIAIDNHSSIVLCYSSLERHFQIRGFLTLQKTSDRLLYNAFTNTIKQAMKLFTDSLMYLNEES